MCTRLEAQQLMCCKVNHPNLEHLAQNRKPSGSETAQDITLTVELLLSPCWLLQCLRHLALFLSPTVYGFAQSDPN